MTKPRSKLEWYNDKNKEKKKRNFSLQQILCLLLLSDFWSSAWRGVTNQRSIPKNYYNTTLPSDIFSRNFRDSFRDTSGPQDRNLDRLALFPKYSAHFQTNFCFQKTPIHGEYILKKIDDRGEEECKQDECKKGELWIRYSFTLRHQMVMTVMWRAFQKSWLLRLTVISYSQLSYYLYIK